MIGAVPVALVAGIAAVAFVAWLLGRVLARQLVHAVEQLAGYSSAALVIVGPAIVLLVATR